MPPANQRRNFFRIHYSPKDCPFFRFQAQNFSVVDLSEEGFKFQIENSKGLELEMDVSGALNFRDGESFLVHGIIRRLTNTEVSIKLKSPLPLRKIMSEQRSLIQKQKSAS